MSGAFNPVRAFGPNLVYGDLSNYWVYPLGSFIGVLIALGVTYPKRFCESTRGPNCYGSSS